MRSRIRKVHMVGIGGAGMCGIAEILLSQGYEISGSDVADSANIQHLRKLGAQISLGHSSQNVGDVQVVVKSTAIQNDNPELQTARERKIAIIPRAEMLAELMRLKHGIAIAGTHGKTTTTSLTATIFDNAGLDPTVIIGGRINVYGTNAHPGQGEYLIAEADESDGSFLCLLPYINVITNIDEDHLDYYKHRSAIYEAFLQFMNRVPFYGLNMVCGDDKGIRQLIPQVKRPVETYGFDEGNDLRAVILEHGVSTRFEIWNKDRYLGEINLPRPGKHNVLNSLAAIGVSLACGISFSCCQSALAHFQGVGRRFDFKGEKNGILVIDDYGHHPTEIVMTLQATREAYPGKRIIVAFQPHRYSRTRDHFEEFCTIFASVDCLLLTEIYASSEKPLPGVSGRILADGIRKSINIPLFYFPTLDEMLTALDGILAPGDILLTLGAGSITRLGTAWLAGQNHA